MSSAAILSRLETCVTRLQKINPKSSSGGSSGSSSDAAPQVVAYEEYYNTNVAPLLETMGKIGGETAQMKDTVEQGFKGLGKVIVLASTHRKPSSNYEETIGQILNNSGIAQALKTSADFRFKNFKSTQVNHLYAVEEGLKVVLWPTTNTTVSYVKEMVNAVSFYTMKVLTSTKGGDNAELHKTYVNQWKSLIEALAVYVKEHHMTGLTFNAKAAQEAK